MRGVPRIGLAVLATAGVAAGTFVVMEFLSDERSTHRPQALQRQVEPSPSHPEPASVAAPEPQAAKSEVPSEALPLVSLRPRARHKPGRGALRAAAEQRVPSPKEPAEEPRPPAVQAALDTTPPPLRILTPQGPAFTMNPKLLLRVRSEAGARLTVNGQRLAEHSSGLFARDLRLVPGYNELELLAEDEAGNRSRVMLRATYIDPSRFRDHKGRFADLLAQLDEIQAAAREMDQRISELLLQIRSSEDANRINELSAELRGIRSTRRMLRGEIKQALEEIDALLARVR